MERSGFTDMDFLHAEGMQLQNAAGETVVLRGTNAGGWLHREGWMDGGGMETEEASPALWSIRDLCPESSPCAALAALTDGDPKTRWSTGCRQEPESAWLTIDMGRSLRINTVELDGGDSAGDYPGAYRVELSEDGCSWREAASGAGRHQTVNVITFTPAQARYVKITQTGSRDNAYWSVAGLRIYRKEAIDDFTGRRLLTDRFGPEKADDLLAIYQRSYFTETDLENIASLGLNFLRVPIYWQVLMEPDGRIKPRAFDRIDWVVEQCARRRLYVMLDLHGAPGGHSAGWLTGGQTGSNALWTTPEYQERTAAIWRTMAARYRGNPAVCAYDLLNEPVAPDDSALSVADFYDRLYREVRVVDPEHCICLEAFFNFDTLGDPKRRGWENVLYQTHHYGENDPDLIHFERGVAAYLTEHRQKWQVPLLAGEFNFWGYPDVWDAWLYDLEQAGISWSNWTYKNIDGDPANNWGFFIGNSSPSIDYQADEYETIARKMDGYRTQAYTRNRFLTGLVEAYARRSASSPCVKGALRPDGFTASASHFPETAQRVLDGDRLSGWSPHARMLTGQWFQVDMGDPRIVDGIVLDAGEGGTGFPRKFHIQRSLDGSLWECVAVCVYDGTATGLWRIPFPRQIARYIRLTQTASYRDIAAGLPFEESVRWNMKGLYLLGEEEARPAVMRRLPAFSGETGKSLTFTLTADGPEAVFRCENLPDGAALEDNGRFVWTPAPSDIGCHRLVFTADTGMAVDRQTVAVTVAGTPELLEHPPLTVAEGDTLVWKIPARGCTAYGGVLPENCRLDTANGVLTWAPRRGQAGAHWLELQGEGQGQTCIRRQAVHVAAADTVTIRRTYTSQDGAFALSEQAPLTMGTCTASGTPVIAIHADRPRQPFLGFGSSLDGSTIYNIVHQPPESRSRLMNTLFHPTQGAGWTCLRICFGASDFAADSFYTYDDLPDGETDFPLDRFSIRKDVERGIPDCIREALAINPRIKIVASVWSPPAWMKENRSLINGGSLRDDCYEALARYYARCVEAYEAAGIPIYAVTLQNEPDVVQPYPTTSFTGEQQRRFLSLLHAAFGRCGITSRIWLADTNFTGAWEYVWKVLEDPQARAQADGVGFHDYAGDPEVMLEVRAAYPRLSLHITERSTYGIEGAARVVRYFRCGMETYNAWLIFLDEKGEPAIGPLDGSNPPQPIRAPHGDIAGWYPTVDYFYYAQVSRYVQLEARILDSDGDVPETLAHTAFRNPDGSTVLYAVNTADTPQPFQVTLDGGIFADTLPAQTAGTYRIGRLA